MLSQLSPFELVNWAEVFLWPLIGTVCFVKATKEKRPEKPQLCALGVTFLIFGLTDVIELKTGAWWRPSGLLFLNALCVMNIAFLGSIFLRN